MRTYTEAEILTALDSFSLSPLDAPAQEVFLRFLRSDWDVSNDLTITNPLGQRAEVRWKGNLVMALKLRTDRTDSENLLYMKRIQLRLTEDFPNGPG